MAMKESDVQNDTSTLSAEAVERRLERIQFLNEVEKEREWRA